MCEIRSRSTFRGILKAPRKVLVTPAEAAATPRLIRPGGEGLICDEAGRFTTVELNSALRDEPLVRYAESLLAGAA